MAPGHGLAVEFVGKNQRDQAQHLAALQQAGTRRGIVHLFGENSGHLVRGRQKPDGVPGLCGTAFQPVPFGQRQQPAQQVGAKMEIVELHFTQLARPQRAFGTRRNHNHVAGPEVLGAGRAQPVRGALAHPDEPPAG